MEVAEGLHRIDTELGTRVSSLYLFVGAHACLLFDVGVDGTAQRDLAPYLASIDVDPARVRWAVISHADVDHFGGSASLRELIPTVTLACHRMDAPLIADYGVFETERARGFVQPWSFDEDPAALAWTREVTREHVPDLTLSGGERVRLDEDWEVELLHVPGHSRGHLAVFDPRSDSLVVSDAVLGDAVLHADGSPAFPPTYRFVDDYLATIARFESMAPQRLLTAHYPTMDAEQALAFLAASRNFAASLDHAILEAVAAAGPTGCTLAALIEQLNPRVGRWPEQGTATALAFPVVGHLERALQTAAIEFVPSDTGPARIRSTS
ncbi:MAG: MBL fold metallo-hydrolase [Nitriliruptoraceae bacterium]|nr:MBL fold metallo-hydrolase [Nitriliruptoraceae bacterium]